MKKNILISALFSFCLVSAGCGFAKEAKQDNAPALKKSSGIAVKTFKDYFTFSIPAHFEKYLSSNEKTAEKDGKYQAGVSHECAKMNVSYIPNRKNEDSIFSEFFGSQVSITSIEDVKKNMNMFLCKRCTGDASETEINGRKAIKIVSKVSDIRTGVPSETEQYIIPAVDGYYTIVYKSCNDEIGKKYRHVLDMALDTFKARKK